jgi:hypothetical protein
VKPSSALLIVALLSSCQNANNGILPPTTRFYFPAGLAHVDAPGSTEGVLFVANANLNKRFASGSVAALSLDKLGLPALGAANAGVARLAQFELAETESVRIASFAGELAVQPLGTDRYRLYIPTRSEGMRVYRVDATVSGGQASLSCVGAEGQDCVDTGTSLTPVAFERTDAGVPRAPSPYGVAVAPRTCTTTTDCCPADASGCGRTCNAGQCTTADGAPFGDVWVTHIEQADSPLQSRLNFRGYLVRLDSDDFTVTEKSFLEAGAGASNSIVASGSWVYASGRFLSPQTNLVRVANRDGTVVGSGLESIYRVSESRGLRLSSDGKRLFLLGRTPDTILTFSITPTGGVPALNVLRGVPVAEGPTALRVIARPGRGDLVVITNTTAGAVSLYDEDVGDVVLMIPGVGNQPYEIAIDERGSAARVYVGNFNDGRIAVIDIPDVNRPQGARLVARIGEQQACLINPTAPSCLAAQAEVSQ